MLRMSCDVCRCHFERLLSHYVYCIALAEAIFMTTYFRIEVWYIKLENYK